MKKIKTKFKDLFIVNSRVFKDNRGWLKEEFKKDFLGEIPINPEVGKSGDEGIPIVEKYPNHEISKKYLEFAENIKKIYL